MSNPMSKCLHPVVEDNVGQCLIRRAEPGRIDLPHGTYMRVAGVTPVEAAELLASARKNRGLRTHIIQRMGSDMENGRYLPTNVFVLSSVGDLLDGQHRLTAQIKVKAILDHVIFVVRDARFDESVIAGLDSGQQRSVADTATLLFGKHVNRNVTSAIQIEAGDGTAAHRTKAEWARIVLDEPLAEPLDRLGQGRKGAIAPVLAAALRCMRKHQDDAVAFFGGVLNRDPKIRNEAGGDGYSASANLLMRVLTDDPAAARERQKTMSKGILAFNAWAEQREMKILRWDGNVVPTVATPVWRAA